MYSCMSTIFSALLRKREMSFKLLYYCHLFLLDKFNAYFDNKFNKDLSFFFIFYFHIVILYNTISGRVDKRRTQIYLLYGY